MAHSVSSIGARVLLAACDELGIDTEQLLRARALQRRELDDPDGRLPPEVLHGLWEDAARQSGDPHFALRVAESIPAGTYRVLEYLVASAPTVGNAFQQISQYFAWIDTSVRLPIAAAPALHGLGLEIEGPPELVPLRALEFTFGTCWLKVRALCHGDCRPLRVDAACPAPADPRRLEQFFSCPWQFESGQNRIWFSAEVWQLRSLHADASLFSVLVQHAEQLVATLEREPALVSDVRRVLYEAGPSLSVAATAKRLGVSTRTLQRRLTEAGAPFASVVDAVRKDLAARLLREQRVGLAEAAYVLGFSDQSSFTRTFKRWTGCTPAVFRANNLAKVRGEGMLS